MTYANKYEKGILKSFFYRSTIALLAVFFMGCKGFQQHKFAEANEFQEAAAGGISVPNRPRWEGEAGQSVSQLANILVRSHNMAAIQRQQLQWVQDKKSPRAQRLAETYHRNVKSAQISYDLLKRMAGGDTGARMTVPFATHASYISDNASEYSQLRKLSRRLKNKRKGRPVVIIARGVTSEGGPEAGNESLARKRAEAALMIVENTLSDIPGERHAIAGGADLYVSSLSDMHGHAQNQYAEILAVYGEDHPTTTGKGKDAFSSDHSGQPGYPGTTMPDYAGAALAGARQPKSSTDNELGMQFVYIPPGTFVMGSPEDEIGRDDDERQHLVSITHGFYMQTTEVTQAQWEAVMGDNPARFKNNGWNHPVEQVSYRDVTKFIRKLNAAEDSPIYRLPTEAEWEYACRAGSRTAFHSGGEENYDHSGYSDALEPIAWYYRNAEQNTHPVGAKEANAWGLYDMHGNVWEWCSDWLAPYPFNHVVDPRGPDSGHARIRRGGSWSHYPMFCRAANRSWYSPYDSAANLGFRLVRELPEQQAKPRRQESTRLPAADRPEMTTATASTKKVGIPAILLEVRDETDPVEVGDNSTYVITATNQGSMAATNVQVICQLEKKQHCIETEGETKAEIENAEVRFAPAEGIPPGGKAVWRVTVKALAAGDIRFQTELSSDQLERPVYETEATTQF